MALLIAIGSFGVFFATPANAQAVNFSGPVDTTTRYALENSATTQATSLTVPVYYRNQPTSAKTIDAYSFVVGKSGISARFIGSGGTPVTLSSNGSFSIPASSFTYDFIAGMYKANVSVSMQGYTGQDYDHFIHFRMQLRDTTGYISYGGGFFQSVANNYPDSDARDTYKLYSLYMATPCNIRVNTANTVRFHDLDHGNRDNGFNPVTVRITDTTTGSIIATRDGASYPVAMGQDGILSINMTFVPGHKYRVDLWDIAGTNVIQYDFPYDNIAYVVPVCPTPQWNTSGSSTASPTGIVTTSTPSVTFTHAITNLASSLDATDKTINAEIFQTVNGGAAISQGTFSRVSGLARGASFSQTDTINTASFVGQVVCQFVRWSPAIWNSSASRQTPQVCVTIAASPRLSIVGGDAVSGGSLGATPCTAGNGGFKSSANTPGSFGEYGVLSTGNIVNFYSAGVTGGTTLTFANTPSYGNFSATRCITDLSASLTNNVGAWSTFSSGQAIPGGTNNYKASGNISIAGSTLGSGSKTLIDARGYTVNITDNIQYGTGTYASFSDAPSLVILADRITVNSNVSTLDGLFIASQNFTTCREAGDTHAVVQTQESVLSVTGACRTTRLTINGAVIVGGQLVTARTAGGGTPAEAPAEIIRFRPEVFLTPYEKGISGGMLMTDFETELPPRN